MIKLITCLLFISMAAGVHAQTTEKEKTVKAYYTGFVNKDWAAVSAQFADGFTFTSPNNDDRISIEKFKEKCFPTAKFVEKVNYIKTFEKGDELVLLVEILTTDGKVIRNIDIYSFNKAGKIKSIEVFFGAGSKYPGNNYKENSIEPK